MRWICLHLVQRLLTVAGGFDLVPPAREPGLDDLDVIGVIVYNQDSLMLALVDGPAGSVQAVAVLPAPRKRSTSATTRRGSHGLAR